jgi:hypothetical protein
MTMGRRKDRARPVVFTRSLQALATSDLVKGKTIAIDATTLRVHAALRSIVRRDPSETYQVFLTRLAQASTSRPRRVPTSRGWIRSGPQSPHNASEKYHQRARSDVHGERRC